jgi:hypothetical protein
MEFGLSTGRTVRVAIDGDESVTRVGNSPGEVLTKAANTIAEAFGDIRDAAADALRTMQAMKPPPTKIELAFGVNLTAEANAVITKVGAAANMTVTVVWEQGGGS